MVITNFPEMEKELSDIARLFKYELELSVFIEIKNEDLSLISKSAIEINRAFFGNGLSVIITINCQQKTYIFNESCSDLDIKRRSKYIAKYHLYHVLKKLTNQSFAWGNLTGIRPVSLYNRIANEFDIETANSMFSSFFDVTEEKLNLVKEIHRQQLPIYTDDFKAVSIYIGIPLCKGRCSYCSFFSADIEKNPNMAKDYSIALVEEINSLKTWLYEEGYKPRSIYIGGGTPSSIPRQDLESILNSLKDISVEEFTVEAGRPDSIDKELLDMFVKYKVTRISINTQSSSDATLAKIGRKHTFNQVKESFELVKNYNFVVNTDIIAGLPDENEDDFIKTINDVIMLKPQNITMHTLALKRGSVLAEADYKHKPLDMENIYNRAYLALEENGYVPYYMYRQKNAAGNLENTGFCIKDTACVYNIDNMEDGVNIIACGAGAISKKIGCGGAVDRLAAPKDIATYISKQQNIAIKKKDFFSTSDNFKK